MSDSSLAKKMKRKVGVHATIIHTPAGYESTAFPGFELPASSLNGTFDWIQIFVRNKAGLDRLAPKATKHWRPIRFCGFPSLKLRLKSRLISPGIRVGISSARSI